MRCEIWVVFLGFSASFGCVSSRVLRNNEVFVAKVQFWLCIGAIWLDV
jgi:hypothetical protein